MRIIFCCGLLSLSVFVRFLFDVEVLFKLSLAAVCRERAAVLALRLCRIILDAVFGVCISSRLMFRTRCPIHVSLAEYSRLVPYFDLDSV